MIFGEIELLQGLFQSYTALLSVIWQSLQQSRCYSAVPFDIPHNPLRTSVRLELSCTEHLHEVSRYDLTLEPRLQLLAAFLFKKGPLNGHSRNRNRNPKHWLFLRHWLFLGQ